MRCPHPFRSLLVATFDEGTREAKVVLRTEVKALWAGAQDWPAFRTFLTWIETACRRQVVLSKEGR